ncbi:MAG: hypothetical protein ACOX63_03640 [Christensenellales bacterium]|jgi:hypothetical protein
MDGQTDVDRLDGQLSTPQEQKKPGLVKKSLDMLEGAVSSLKGKDINHLIEVFTSEMTLVAEGLSEDQVRTSHEVADLSARQTILEEEANAFQADNARQLQTILKRLDALEKQQVSRKTKKSTLLLALRQATWLAAILAAAWIITAAMKFFGGQ